MLAAAVVKVDSGNSGTGALKSCPVLQSWVRGPGLGVFNGHGEGIKNIFPTEHPTTNIPGCWFLVETVCVCVCVCTKKGFLDRGEFGGGGRLMMMVVVLRCCRLHLKSDGRREKPYR